MDFNEILKKGSCAFYNGEEFLKRIHNQFDTAIRTVIYGVDAENEKAVFEKIDDLFGKVIYEKRDDCIVIEPVNLFDKTRNNFSDLVEIVYRLRDPDGCPWDRAQTNATIRRNIIEEAYELTEAIDLNDSEKMTEESGDVMLQSVLTAAIAKDGNKFSVDDVITGLVQKLINRHTHIFGKDKASSAEDALKFWDKAKEKEKKYSSVKDKIESIPVTFGALMYADKLQKYIKKTGFDFPDVRDAVDKLYEEINEFLSAEEKDKESEGGDVLFSVVNILRMCDIDPEVALNGTSHRFKDRFYYVIEQAEKQGKRVEELTLEEMEGYYREGKCKNRLG